MYSNIHSRAGLIALYFFLIISLVSSVPIPRPLPSQASHNDTATTGDLSGLRDDLVPRGGVTLSSKGRNAMKFADQVAEVATALGSKFLTGPPGSLLLSASNLFGVAANYTDDDFSPTEESVSDKLGRLSRVLGTNAKNSGMAR